MSMKENKNYMYSIIYRVSICVLPLVVTPYISRVLGPNKVGIYSYSSTVACYFIMLGKLGIDTYGNRSIAACKDNVKERSKVFLEIYFVQILTAILAMVTFIVLIQTQSAENKIVYWMQLMYVASALFDVSWFFFGMEKFRITTIRSIISRGLIIALVYYFVHTEQDLWKYTAVMSFCFLLEQVQLFVFLPKYITKVSITKKGIYAHILPNLKLFLPLIAISIYNWTDKILLGWMLKSTAVVAFYAYAENIINLPKGILTALDSMMLPRISNLVAQKKEKLGVAKMKNSIRFNSFVCCVLSFGIVGVAKNFISWFFGEEYAPSIGITMLLAIVMIPMCISNVIQNQYLIPFHKERIYTRAVSIGAGVNLIFNIACIPVLGVYGAVLAKFMAEMTVCVYQLYQIREIYSVRELKHSLLPFLICGVFEVLVTYGLSYLSLGLLLRLAVQIAVGGLVYLISCYIYIKGVKKEVIHLKDMF